MSEINEKWSSLEETAEYLGVTKDTIRSWIKKTDIPAHKVGRLWKFKFSEVDEWVKSGKSALQYGGFYEREYCLCSDKK